MKDVFFKIILIFVLSILLCIASIFLSKEVYEPEVISNIRQNEEIINEVQAENEIQEEVVIIPNDETITISVIGDIMCHNTQYKDAYNSSTGEYDFSYVFDDIKEYVELADLAIGNLETTLAGKEIGYSSYPTFNTPEKLATDLAELGIDVLSTANNHSLDKGFKGIENTIDELDKAGIKHTGTFKTEEDSNDLLITEIKGIKIGFVSYTYGTNGIPVPNEKEFCINLIDDEKIISDLNKMKNEKVDITIAIMHWGEEYQTSPNNEQERLAKLLIENGVDLILGSHPHVLQKMEKYDVVLEDGTEKDCFAMYSMGNFISGQVKKNTKQSVILNLELTKHYDGNKKISIDSVKYTPIYMYDKNGTPRYKLLDIEKEIEAYENGEKELSTSLYNTLKSELEHIYNVVGNEI